MPQLPLELWHRVAVCLASGLPTTEWHRAAAVLSSVSKTLREAAVGSSAAALWEELSFVSSPLASSASSASLNRCADGHASACLALAAIQLQGCS